MLTPGETLDGKYRIIRIIGSGGMGTVYEGENVRIKRRVAIKVLNTGAAASAELCVRFEREAQAAGRIGSDHITEVLDLGQLASGDRYIVMEYLDGEPLSARMTRHRRMPAETLLPLVRQLLLGLDAAHAAGVVHRDIKPDNVFVVHQKAGLRDFVKLLDFGVSKFRDVQANMSLTRTGAVVGTSNYLSPEQARGEAATTLSDLYAVGVILYQGITGEMPFRGSHFNELVLEIVFAPLVPPIERAPEVSPALNSIVCKAMARAPEHRFQSAREFIAAVDAHLATGAGVELPRAVVDHAETLVALDASPTLPPVPAEPRGAFRASSTSVMPISHAQAPLHSATLAEPRSRAGVALGVVAVFTLLSGGVAAWYWNQGRPRMSIEGNAPARGEPTGSVRAPASAATHGREPPQPGAVDDPAVPKPVPPALTPDVHPAHEPTSEVRRPGSLSKPSVGATASVRQSSPPAASNPELDAARRKSNDWGY